MRYHLMPKTIAIIKKKKRKVIVGEGAEKFGPSCVAEGDVKWCSRKGKQSSGSLKTETQNYQVTQQVPS